MKKFLFLFLLAVLALLATSCAKEDDTKGNVVKIALVDDIAQYKVVRGDMGTDGEKEAAVTLHKALYSMFDTIKIGTDSSSSSKELLVGKTKRAESVSASEGLGYYDYVIKQQGSKIIVVGGSDESLMTAVNVFIDNFINSEKKTVSLPTGDMGYTYKKEYAVDKLTFEGISLGEFRIFNTSLIETNEILKKFRTSFGIDLEKEYDKIKPGVHYVIIDGTEFIADKYSITLSDGNITIKGSARTLPYAIDTFIEKISSAGKKEYDLTAADSFEGSYGATVSYTKDQIMTSMKQVYADKDKIIIGEEASYAVNCISSKMDEFYGATGEYPGIIGIDLACYGVDILNKTDTEWSALICDIVDYCAQGGLLTASAHWDNPSGNTMGDARCRGELGYDNSLEGYQKAFTELLNDGTEYNNIFKNEISENARFLEALGDNGVTVIWRPLHEANGNWFWFCTNQGSNFVLDPSYIVGVWKYVYNYFDELGLENLIWCYAPNVSENINDEIDVAMSTTYLYPGDEYCDIVGVDWYTKGNMEITSKDNYLILVDHAKKPGAITEFGPSGITMAENIEDQPDLYSCMDLYGNLYSLSREDYSFIYLLTWGGKCGVAALGKGEEFMAQEMTLGLAEVKAILDNIK